MVKYCCFVYLTLAKRAAGDERRAYLIRQALESKRYIQVDSFFTPAGIQRLDPLAFSWRCLAIAWLLAFNATSKNKETLPHVTNTPHPPLPTD